METNGLFTSCLSALGAPSSVARTPYPLNMVGRQSTQQKLKTQTVTFPALLAAKARAQLEFSPSDWIRSRWLPLNVVFGGDGSCSRSKVAFLQAVVKSLHRVVCSVFSRGPCCPLAPAISLAPFCITFGNSVSCSEAFQQGIFLLRPIRAHFYCVQLPNTRCV